MTDDSLIDDVIAADPCLSRVTDGAISEALRGTGLHNRVNAAWLGRAVRGALLSCSPTTDEDPCQVAAIDVRGELARIAKAMDQAALLIGSRSNAVDDALIGALHLDGIEGNELAKWQHGIDMLAVSVRRAIMRLEMGKPHWREKLGFELRVQRGQALSVVFEKAFGAEAIPSDGSVTAHSSLWPSFYGHIMRIAFNEVAVINQGDVLREVRRRHLRSPWTFAPGVVPEPPLD